MFWVKCPHCKKTIEEGYSGRPDRIESPIKNCPECGKIIIDNDALEWGVASLLHKFLFCSFGNWRGYLHFITLLVMATYEAGLTVFIPLVIAAEGIAAIVGYFIVLSLHEDDIRASYDRVENPEYIATLSKIEYRKLAEKYNDDEWLSDICRGVFEKSGGIANTKRSEYVETVQYVEKTMVIKLRSGETYLYNNFPRKVYLQMMNAPSIGDFYKYHVHGKYFRIRF